MSAQNLRTKLQILLNEKVLTQAKVASRIEVDPAQLSRFLKRHDDKGLPKAKLAALKKLIDHSSQTGPPLSEQHAAVLAEKLANDQLVLFVGAGLSHLAPAKDGSSKRLPLWQALNQQVAEKCHVTAFDNPLDTFDDIQHDQGRPDLEEAIHNALNDEKYSLSEAHEALKALPWHQVVTTNYDGLLQRLFNPRCLIAEERNYSRQREDYDLIHWHGTLINPHTLTREDYRDWALKNPLATHYLQDLLINKTILFVGYSLQDPHLDNLLTTVRKITAGYEKRLYAWMWQADEHQIRLLDRRDKITVVPVRREEDWSTAFQQLKIQLKQPSTAAPTEIHSGHDVFSYDRTQYQRAMQAHYGHANLSALYLPGAGYARDDVLLKEIFVEPDLVNTQQGQPSMQKGLSVDTDATEDELTEQHKLAYLRQREQQSETQRQPAAELAKKHSKLVILGAPGQGKSTLLRYWLLDYLSAWQANPRESPFPFFLRLSEWQPNSQNMGLLQRLIFEVTKFSEVGVTAVRQWQQSPVIWLLDGIDEIRNPQQREALRDELRSIAAQRPQDRFIVTSRPAGYPSGGLGSDWEETELPELSNLQIQHIIQQWADVLERKERLILPISDLQEALEKQPGLQRLRGNSLLLTLAILFYKANRRLPQDRWEFYEHAGKALRDSWARHRNSSSGDALPNDKYLEALLQKLAIDGMQRGVVVFSRRQLEAESEAILQRYQYSGKDLDDEVQRILHAAENLIGVLVAQGPEQFGFLHLTFQEFYAAQYLYKHSQESIANIAGYWDHPDWVETWALYAIGIGEDAKRLDELFTTIQANGHEWDDFLCRPQLMCLKLMGVGNQPLPGDLKVYSDMVNWSIEALKSRNVKGKWVVDIFKSAEKAYPPILKSRLLELLEDKNEYDFARTDAIDILAKVVEQDDVWQAFLHALQEKSRFVGRSAAEALAALAEQDNVQQALLSALQRDTYVGEIVAQSLARVADRKIVQRELLNALENKDARFQHYVISALSGVVEQGNVWRALLYGVKEEINFWSAARALSRVAEKNEVQEALICALRDKNEDKHVRQIAAHALSGVVEYDDIQKLLISVLQDENEDQNVREAATSSLAEAVEYARVQQVLVFAIKHKNHGVRWRAASALAKLVEQDNIQHVLLYALKHAGVNWVVVKALAKVVENEPVKKALLNVLKDQRSARSDAVEALAKVVDHEVVKLALLDALNDKNSIVRWKAAEALTKLVKQDVVQQALLDALKDKDLHVRRAAIKALSTLVEQDDVRQALLCFAKDMDGITRSYAINALAKLADNGHVQDVLLDAVKYREFNVRSAAAEALQQQIAFERFGHCEVGKS